MTILNYWTIIGFLIFFDVFLITKWVMGKLADGGQIITFIFTFFMGILGFGVIPIETAHNKTLNPFEVVKVTKTEEKVILFNNKGEYFAIDRTWKNDTIKPGVTFIKETKYNLYNYKTEELKLIYPESD